MLQEDLLEDGELADVQAVWQEDVRLPAEEMLGFHARDPAHRGEAVCVLGGCLLKEVLGLHMVPVGFLLRFQGGEHLVERGFRIRERPAEDRGVGGEDSADAWKSVADVEQPGAGEPFVELLRACQKLAMSMRMALGWPPMSQVP